MAIWWQNQLIAISADFAVKTTLAGNAPPKLMVDAKEADYKITLVYIGLANAILEASRVIDRVRCSGHSVPLEDVERRYSDTTAKLRTALGIAARPTCSTTAAHDVACS